MKPVEITPIARGRPPAAVSATTGAPSSPPRSGAAASPSAEPGMVTRSETLSAGAAAPVDSDRVATIRSAVREGTYPLVPATVADAMIAASFILIEGRKD